MAERFWLPAATVFLLAGIAFGPNGLGILSGDLLGQLGFVEPLALGIIVFLVGEQLTLRMIITGPSG